MRRRGCGARVIERDGCRLGEYRLTADGRCELCGTSSPGLFGRAPGIWGTRRLPVRLAGHRRASTRRS